MHKRGGAEQVAGAVRFSARLARVEPQLLVNGLAGNGLQEGVFCAPWTWVLHHGVARKNRRLFPFFSEVRGHGDISTTRGARKAGQ